MALKTIAAVAAGPVVAPFLNRIDFHSDPRLDAAIKAGGGLTLALVAGKFTDGAMQTALISVGVTGIAAAAAEFVPFLEA